MSADHDHDLPVDPDVDVLVDPVAGGVVLAVIALGGALGSAARWSLGEALATGDGRWPWATFVENVTGSLALGFLVAVVTRRLPDSRYVRPFAGVGFLGGWTTFSTYALDTRGLLADGHPVTAVLYLAASLVVGVAAAAVGLLLAHRFVPEPASEAAP